MEFAGLKNVNIKDEPIDYLENMDSMDGEVVSENNTVDVDPMNLLEIVAQRCSDDEHELTRSSVNVEGAEGNVDKWSQWIKTFPWLLRRAEGKRLGFCLYCGKNMNVEGPFNLERHNCALIHKERQQNYEAFLLSCKESFDEEGLNAIKEEIDADNTGRVSEGLVASRLEKSKALNDFNWKNWLSAHSWLVRENSEDELSTKGYCKYCKCVFDVEFSLTRQRHEQSIKHKLGGNTFFTEENGDGEPFDGSEDFSKAIETDIDAMDETTINNIDIHVTSKVLKGRLFDKVSGSSRQRLCRVCRVVMDKHSCRKHIKSKLHRKNMQALAISSRKDKKISVMSLSNMPVDWSKFTKIHSWICADPDDPKYAYCSYCEKRFMYGLSVVKRALHEKSQSHCEAMKRKLGNREGNNGVATEANGYQQNESLNMEYDCEESEANGSILKRKRAQFSDKWFELNPCYQRNENDEDYIYCKCCSVNLLIKNLNIHKHERAERHKQAAQLYAERPISNITSTHLQTRKENPIIRFPWIRRTKNGQVFCKFCRIVLSAKYKPAAHEQTERHKWAAEKYYSRKNEQDNEGFTIEHKSADGLQGGDSVVSDEEMKPTLTIHHENGMNWQQKYEWLTFHESEIRQFYGFCNYCKQSVFVPTSTFAAKHEISSIHLRSQLNQRRQSELETSQMMAKNEGTHKYKLYKWLLPDPEENRNFGYCKYCKTRVMTEGLMALGHHNSRSHRKATELYMQNHKNDGSDDECSMMDVSHTDQLHNMESINPEESGSEMSSLATRLNNAHTEMLSLIREMKGNNNRQNQNIPNLPGPGHSAATTADTDLSYSRLSEQLNGKPELKKAKYSERNTYDLFFDSMNEAVKKLPSDLAAESRIKIMQIVYDLEMRALQRTQTTQQQATQSPQRETPSPQTTTAAIQEENATSITNPTNTDADAVDDDDDEHQKQDDDEEIIPDSGELSTNQCTNSDAS
ncbi:protein suppressor of variegation 3-7 [Eurosta solidaginis]|uniref:protein suppressor of variegation 3-7 n=1 Tax=Eurosta solidaginis TaxID=178769 RepID=UPI003530DC42